MTRICTLIMLAVVLLPLALAASASAQVELYSVTHPFALPTATTTRLFGMGGFSSCIPDAGFANPAFAGALTEYSAVARKSVTSFEGDLGLNSQQVSVAFPLRKHRSGMQITGFHMASNDPAFTSVPVPSTLSFSEDDVSIHYGRRVGQHWLVGVAASPVFRNEVDLMSAAAPVSLLHLESEAKWGVRVGSVYELGRRGWIGAVYDRYDEDVTATGPLVGGGPVNATFRSHEIVAGVSYWLTDRLLAAVEWQQLGNKGLGATNTLAGWRFGLEGLLDDGVAVRLGSNQTGLSVGAGWSDERWGVNYAFIRDWNEDVFGAVFGASNTHSFETTFSW